MMSVYLIFCGFLFGLAIGSFLNVVIYRVPAHISIVHPPSNCPHCHRQIRIWENIPLISYFFILRGKCAGCGQPISLQYPVIELFTAVIFTLVIGRFGLTFQSFVYLVFSAILIALSVIDIHTRLLPDDIVLPGFIGACLLSVVSLAGPFRDFWNVSPQKAFWGMVAGGFPLLLLAWGYMKLTSREGMGGGDIKLMFFIGALLGPLPALLTIFLGSLLGSVVGVLYLRLTKRGRSTQIPFGPFLSFGAWIAMMWGDQMIQTYLHGMGFRQGH